MLETQTVVPDQNDPRFLEVFCRQAGDARNINRNKYALLSPDDVDRLCTQQHRSRSFVEGFMSHSSVSMLVGDSGLGKSPLAYQLGLCVSAGIPFLNMKTEPGLVVYADYENGLIGSRDLRNALLGFLELEAAPDNFRLWTPESAAGDALAVPIDGICEELSPTLLIIDSLRAHDPTFESTENAGQGMAHLRSVASKNGVAILVVHHIKKPGTNEVPELDDSDTVLIQWLKQAAGHSSIINQSDTRVGAGLPNKAKDAAMVLRWHRRLYGEGGPLYVERVHDTDGVEIGYRRMTGASLLGNDHQEKAIASLAHEFTFKEAKQAYERHDDPTRKWLLKCHALGLVEQVKRGIYRKTENT